MSKKINKEIIDSENLLKHLEKKAENSHEPDLDDFEKEALEGFSSLENPELSKKINDELTKKIENRYFKKEDSKKPIIYWSMAAGLALIIGLSIFFFNNLTKKETNLAYFEEQKENTGKQNEEISKNNLNDSSSETLKQQVASSSEKVAPALSGSSSEQQSDGRTPAPKSEAKDLISGPGNAALSSSVEVQHNVPNENSGSGGKDANLAKAESGYYGKYVKDEEKEKDRDDKNSDKALQEKPAEQSRLNENKRDESKAKKSAEQKPEVAYNSPQAPSSIDYENDVAVANKSANSTTNTQSTKQTYREKSQDDKSVNGTETKTPSEPDNSRGAAAKGDLAMGSTMRKSSFFKTPKFANQNDYFKSEIDKNETLKNNLLNYNKAFKIELSIDEKGKVSKANADISEKKCSGCKKEMEKIILSMPAWEPAELNDGKPVQQSFYFTYLYK